MLRDPVTVPTPTPPPDRRAEEIFSRTRAAFAARAFASTTKYALRISGFRNNVWSGRTYDAFERWPEQSVFVRAISEEETAHPYTPALFGFGAPGPQSGGPQGPRNLGFPQLTISYAFGLAARGPIQASVRANDGGLRTIGSVRAVARIYDVRLAGEEAVDGNSCWHLTLRPIGNAGTYRVRDLWVDETSYETRKLTTDGNFTSKETGSGLWTATYMQTGDAWYLDGEISQGKVAGYDHVAVQFIDVAADPHENLDFGLAGSKTDLPVIEPADPLPRR